MTRFVPSRRPGRIPLPLTFVLLTAACGDAGGVGAGSPPPAGSPPADAVQVAPEVAQQKLAAAEQQAAALADAPAFTNTFKHPAGVFFLYPDRWKVQDADGAMRLIPDDVHMVDGQPGELTLVIGEPAADVQRVSDPQVAQQCEQVIAASFPTLRRNGAAKTTKLGPHEVLELRWRATSAGHEMRAALRVTLLSGYALGTFTLATADCFEARDRTMADILRTFGYEKPASDPRLCGHWRYEKTYSSGTFSSVTIRDLQLRADGSCLEGGQLFAGMEHTDSTGDVTGSTSAESGGGVNRGRWRNEGKELVIEWGAGGSERWSIYVEGDSMLWQSGSTKKLWQRVR